MRAFVANSTSQCVCVGGIVNIGIIKLKIDFLFSIGIYASRLFVA